MEFLNDIHAIMILDKQCNKILSKYSNTFQQQFESKEIENELKDFLSGQESSYSKQNKLFLFKDKNLLVKYFSDFQLVILAEEEENEIFLNHILKTLNECFEYFCGREPKLENLFNFLPQVLLVLDEVFSERGIILTLRTNEITSRVMMQETNKPRVNLFFGRQLIF